MIEVLLKEKDRNQSTGNSKVVCKKAAWLILLYTGVNLLGFVYFLLKHNSTFLLANLVLLPFIYYAIWNLVHLKRDIYLLSILTIIVFLGNFIYIETDYYKNMITASLLIMTGTFSFSIKANFESLFYKYWFYGSKIFQIVMGIAIIVHCYEKSLGLYFSFGTMFFTGGLLLFFIIYSIFIVNMLIKEYSEEGHKSQMNANEYVLNEQEEIQLKKLTQFFEESDQYTQIQFSFDTLSENLNIPKNELSHLIHKVYGVNFYKFIAFIRISYAMEKLKNIDEQTTIENIMLESGFSSKPTFYKYFKEITGGTPSDYIKNFQ